MNIPEIPLATAGYSPQETKSLARQWTKTLWNDSLWKHVRWLGVPVMQWPTDLLIMQELIASQRPKIIVETGLYLGGTSVFYASILELLRIEGRVISIDIQINSEARANIEASAFRNKITLIEGDSKSEAVHREIASLVSGEEKVLVTLDADHSYSHTLGELRAFSRYIPVGGYMVLFDTICEDLADVPNGDPAWLEDSPMRAVREFLAEDVRFESDSQWEKFMVTFAPCGFLRRKT